MSYGQRLEKEIRQLLESGIDLTSIDQIEWFIETNNLENLADLIKCDRQHFTGFVHMCAQVIRQEEN